MSNKTYDVLKFVAAIILPLSEFVSVLSNIWGWAYGAQVAATLAALDVFVGSIVIYASAKYNS